MARIALGQRLGDLESAAIADKRVGELALGDQRIAACQAQWRSDLSRFDEVLKTLDG